MHILCLMATRLKVFLRLGFVDLPVGDEHKMMEAVASLGPISVAIDASLDSFSYYSKGIYNDRRCKKDDTDHAVLVKII